MLVARTGLAEPSYGQLPTSFSNVEQMSLGVGFPERMVLANACS